MSNSLSLDDLQKQANLSPEAILGPKLRALEVIAVAGNRELFEREESPEGVPWAKLKHERPEGGNAKILRDKGLLYNSISATATAKELILYANHAGAATHQFGATITPKNAKALAIPLTVEAKRVGSPRRNGFPRPLFIWRSRSGVDRKVFLCEAKEGGGLVFHYILLQSVKIPARPFLGFSDRTLAKIARVILDGYSEAVLNIFRGKVSPAQVVT